MRLYRWLVRTSKAPSGKKFYRYVVPVPTKHIKALGWTEETKLTSEVRGEELVIRRA